jgi:hypothetical protein
VFLLIGVKCRNEFATLENLNKHPLRDHEAENLIIINVKCVEPIFGVKCRKEFAALENLIKHQQKGHEAENLININVKCVETNLHA